MFRLLSTPLPFKLRFRLALLGLLCVVTGCSQNPYFAGPAGANWNNPQTASVNQTEARISELSRRVQLLDDNNRQLHTQLAQSEQQAQVFRDESELLRKQLGDMSQRAESTAIAARDAQSQVRGMQASTQIRGGASIQANTNLSQMASRLNLGGIPVVQDGDVLRIIVPADQLFRPGTAQLLPQASSAIDPIAAQLRSAFPAATNWHRRVHRQRADLRWHRGHKPPTGGRTSISGAGLDEPPQRDASPTNVHGGARRQQSASKQ